MPDTAHLPTEAVEAYLNKALPGFSGPLDIRKFDEGQSNPTFLLTAASGRYVLRRKPPGQLLKSAHAVDREFRVMSALLDSEVPVPRPLLLCEDESVIGSMFFVMEFKQGRSFGDPRMQECDNQTRSGVYDELNRVLAALHSIDVEAVGLGDFGRPGNYFGRQLSRWSDQYRATATENQPDMERLMAWLEASLPPDDGQVSLVHGDYRIDNAIFHLEHPEMIALIDWELSTLGHPLADLGYQCMQWRMPVGKAGRGLEGVDRAALGIPSEETYLESYCKRRGLAEIADWPFYLAFAFFRFAAILQGVKRRALDGNASNPEQGLALGTMVPVLAERGAALIEEA